jgi:hypothetical protein
MDNNGNPPDDDKSTENGSIDNESIEKNESIENESIDNESIEKNESIENESIDNESIEKNESIENESIDNEFLEKSSSIDEESVEENSSKDNESVEENSSKDNESVEKNSTKDNESVESKLIEDELAEDDKNLSDQYVKSKNEEYFLGDQSIKSPDKSSAPDDVDSDDDDSDDDSDDEQSDDSLLRLIPLLFGLLMWYILRTYYDIAFPANLAIGLCAALVLYFLLPLNSNNRAVEMKNDDSVIIDVPITAATIYAINPLSGLTISIDEESDQVRVKF